MIVNRLYEHQNLLSLWRVSCLVGLRTYQHPCIYRGADNSLARPTSRCILFDGENIAFDASLVIYINSTNIRRSQWPRSLRRWSTAARLLRSWVRISLGHECLSVVSVVYCQVEVSATDWSFVQGSPTDCGASLCVIKKPRTRGGYSPLEGCKIQTHNGL
jgi:hypothetical protein